MAKKQSSSKRIKKKKWFPVIAPKIFGSKVLGESLLIDSSAMKGRFMKMNLMNVTGDPKRNSVNIQFKIKEVREGQGITEIVKYERIHSFLKRIVRRGRNKIEDSFIVKTSDNKRARIKTIVITNSYSPKSVGTNIRLTARKIIKEHISKNSFERNIEEIMKGMVMKETKSKLSKIAPVRTFDIRVFKLEAKKGTFEEELPVEEELTEAAAEEVEKEIKEEDAKEERTLDFLKSTVEKIYSALKETEVEVEKSFSILKSRLPKEITFIHSEELEKMYPDLTSKEREYEIAKKYGAVFLIGIGFPLASGKPHDLRAADYDDWSTKTSEGHGLDGDIIVWDDQREDALELSSMGIRVDKESLLRQIEMTGLSELKELPFQKGIIEGLLPLSIGGGIGQSRMCMLLLQKVHIGEVQSSIWSEDVIEECKDKGVTLL